MVAGDHHHPYPRRVTLRDRTVTFTLLIRERMDAGRGESFAAFAARSPDLFEGGSELLGRHYDPATLATAEARRRFVLPDREPLPGSATFSLES